MVKTFGTSIIIGLISVLVLAQPQVVVLGNAGDQNTSQDSSTENKSKTSQDSSTENKSKSPPTPSKTPTQETSSSNPSSLLTPPLIISMISLMVGLTNLIVLISFLGLAFPKKYKYLLDKQRLVQELLDSIQESLIKQSYIIGNLDRAKIPEYMASYDQQLSKISQQIQRASDREPSSQNSPPGQPIPKDPRQGIVDYQSVIEQFNANNSNWFREQIGLGFFQKVQANETQDFAGRVIQISLQPSGSLLKYKVNGTEWVIPDRTQERWYLAVSQSLFRGFQPQSYLIRPAELELRGNNIWQVKEPGQFQ